jgi:hypothetical protein
MVAMMIIAAMMILIGLFWAGLDMIFADKCTRLGMNLIGFGGFGDSGSVDIRFAAGSLWIGPSALILGGGDSMGLRPMLVWNAPLAFLEQFRLGDRSSGLGSV